MYKTMSLMSTMHSYVNSLTLQVIRILLEILNFMSFSCSGTFKFYIFIIKVVP